MTVPGPPTYVGRFAPSPTGALHFGSLVSALGSFLRARSLGGRWLVRIEDLDAPRNVPGADREILSGLERLGLHWDGPVVYQSARESLYLDALSMLSDAGWSFPCTCTRRDLDNGVYAGACRLGLASGRSARSTRLRVHTTQIAFEDAVFGRRFQDLETEVGDFVIHRADGIVAYHLAVVVDDAVQGITEVVRGADLLDSTPRQILLQRALGRSTPAYAHVPLVVAANGTKLSKHEAATPIASADPATLLVAALGFLGQPTPDIGSGGPSDDLLEWAVRHFDVARIPRAGNQPADLDASLQLPASRLHVGAAAK